MYKLIIDGGPGAMVAVSYARGKQLRGVTIYQELGDKMGWLQTLAGPSRQSDLPGNDLMQLLTSCGLP